jgi:hypothetical protein
MYIITFTHINIYITEVKISIPKRLACYITDASITCIQNQSGENIRMYKKIYAYVQKYIHLKFKESNMNHGNEATSACTTTL